MKQILTFYRLLAGLMIIGSTGCFNLQSYKTYEKTDDSLILLKFEYPSDWNWDVEAKEQIIASDPEGNGDFGISVYEKKSVNEAHTNMNEKLQERFLFGADRNAYIIFEPIVIDGYLGKHITLDLPAYPRQGNEKPWIQETYYLVIGNRLHIISINIDKDQRNGAFGRGFDHVIKTIRVIEPPPAP